MLEAGENSDKALRRTPASLDKWYMLATVCKEIRKPFMPSLSDRQGHIKNRRIWNAWMCQNLADDERRQLSKRFEIHEADLAPLDESEVNAVLKRFRDKFGADTSIEDIPAPSDRIRFQNIQFQNPLLLDGFILPASTEFEKCKIGLISLNKSKIIKSMSFSECEIDMGLSIKSTHSEGTIYFDRCDLGQIRIEEWRTDKQLQFWASNIRNLTIKNSTLKEGLVIDECRVKGVSDFSDSAIHQVASFSESTFEDHVYFYDTNFLGPVSFRNTKFTSHHPIFAACQPHNDMRFTASEDHWPATKSDNAEEGRVSYMFLRRIASSNHDTDLEHFFLRQEMRCKEQLSEGADKITFMLFRILSGNGTSIKRPLTGILLITAFGWPIFSSFLKNSASTVSNQPMLDGLTTSLVSTLPFLRLNSKLSQAYAMHAPASLDILSYAQTTLGIILLFLLGLGLRNKFRIK